MMNKIQEERLQLLANSLSRTDENDNPQDLPATERRIKEIVTDIYRYRFDVQTVLKVERILNSGYVNVARNTRGAKERMTELTEKSEIGLDLHKKFKKNPKHYVECIEMANKGIGRSKGEGRRFVDGVPIEPVRAAFMQFREQLRIDSNQAGHTLDRQETAKSRFDATIAGERLFIGEYLAHRQDEREDKKQEHLQNFDRRMEKLIREVERKKPPERSKGSSR